MALMRSGAQSPTAFRAHRSLNGTDFAKNMLRILKSCANCGDAQIGMSLHSHITENAIYLETFLGNALLNMYVKCGQLEDAANLMPRIPEKNSVSWTVMITCFAKRGLYKDALNLYREMDVHHEKPDPVTFVCLLNACICEDSLKDGKNIHSSVYIHKMEMDIVIGSCVINMYAEFGYLAEARLVFDQLPCRNVVTWTSIITAYSVQGFAEEALSLFQKLQKEAMELDQVIFRSLLKACSNVGALFKGKQYHVVVMYAGFKHDTGLDNALINMYAKCGRLEASTQIFERMKRKDVASWSLMIAGCTDASDPMAALDYYMKMQQNNVKPNNVTYVSILKVCGNLTLLNEGQIIHDRIVKEGCCMDIFVTGSLIEMYIKCGEMDASCHIFNNSEKKDVALWTTMINGCTQQGHYEEALILFHRMQMNGFKANQMTFTIVLSSCAHIIAWEQGLQVHDDVCRNQADSSIEVNTALINMYGKCGWLREAQSVFNRIQMCAVIAWTAMIVAYAENGHGIEAFDLLLQMHQSGMEFDHVSLTGVLAACDNAGLVSEALLLFHMISSDYGLLPSEKHYSCIIDALGRSGQIDNALAMVTFLTFQPNSVSHRSLVGACKNHVDQIAEDIIKFELCIADVGDFILLLNLYRSINIQTQSHI